VTGQDNGDAFFFYPPRKDGGDLDYCGQNGHRLVPSIRWENLRDGMEDYEYLWLLAGGDPEVDVTNAADAYVAQFAGSRTKFSRVPTDLAGVRAAIAQALSGPRAAKSVSPGAVPPGGALMYTLDYFHSGAETTLVVTDSVPVSTSVVTATGPGSVLLVGQHITWSVAVSSGTSVTLNIQAMAGDTPGVVVNRAVFSSTVVLSGEARVQIFQGQLFLPLVMR
jgi:hypothetical protein